MRAMTLLSPVERPGGHSSGQESKQTDAAAAKRRHLLLVDDDRLILATLSDGLRESGYDVTVASSGAEALEATSREQFDLAILDVRMPGMDGLELGRRLHDHTRIPFIFLSAYGDLELVRDAADHGALGYMLKPVDAPQLVPSIEAAFARGGEIQRLRETASQLNTALAIEQRTRMAVGLLMERERLDRRAAFDLLRSTARSSRRKVADVAEELLSATELLNAVALRKSAD
jgi:two-component system, response regulator PdtaR